MSGGSVEAAGLTRRWLYYARGWLHQHSVIGIGMPKFSTPTLQHFVHP